MGKKDEMIKELENKVNDLTSEKRVLKISSDDLKAKNDGLSTGNKILTDKIGELMESHNQHIKQYQDKIAEITEYKSLMITTVNVTGVGDITNTLNNAVKLLEDRLEALGLKDKYTILAVPHTMSLGIVR